jgi:hypothetical protein
LVLERVRVETKHLRVRTDAGAEKKALDLQTHAEKR